MHLSLAADSVPAFWQVARGMPPFGYTAKFAADDEACISTHLVGQPACGYFRWLPFMKVMTSYGFAKAIGTLYFQNAAAEFSKAIQADPTDGVLYSNRANVYFELGEYDKARDDAVPADGHGVPL